jgi:hypothetical protein
MLVQQPTGRELNTWLGRVLDKYGREDRARRNRRAPQGRLLAPAIEGGDVPLDVKPVLAEVGASPVRLVELSD